jgi:NTE family protein
MADREHGGPGPKRQFPTRAQWLRRLATRRRAVNAFVLSGGGPLGALQVGALRALLEAGIAPDLVVGTSIGAINGTMLAFDPTPRGVDALEATWRRIRDGDLFPGGRLTSWARCLVRGERVFDNSGIRRLVEMRIGRAAIEDAQVPLAVVATELETGKEHVFSTGEAVAIVVASAAMPGVFPPVEIDGVRYIDGGVSNNVPVAPALDLGATNVYVLDATARTQQRRPLVRPIDYLLHAFSLARSQRAELERIALAERARILTVPMPRLDHHIPFASVEHTPRLIDLGYESATRFLSGAGSSASLETPDAGVVTR